MPVVAMADLSFDVMAVYYLAVAMPHFMLNRVSAWITVIITLERCLCIIFPLQVMKIIQTRGQYTLLSHHQYCSLCLYLSAPPLSVSRMSDLQGSADQSIEINLYSSVSFTCCLYKILRRITFNSTSLPPVKQFLLTCSFFNQKSTSSRWGNFKKRIEM